MPIDVRLGATVHDVVSGSISYNAGNAHAPNHRGRPHPPRRAPPPGPGPAVGRQSLARYWVYDAATREAVGTLVESLVRR